MDTITLELINKIKDNPNEVRYMAKELVFRKEHSPEEKMSGIKILELMRLMGDIEAKYYLGLAMLAGIISAKQGDSRKHALSQIHEAALQGCTAARIALDQYHNNIYSANIDRLCDKKEYQGPLVDFNGKVINIKRTGVMTPVDAELTYKDGRNTLLLSLNVRFELMDEEIADEKAFMCSVCKGIMDWEGEYEVFGGQKLTVKINLTTKPRTLDNVKVIALTPSLKEMFHSVTDKIHSGKNAEIIHEMLDEDRSFATTGIVKWSVTSRKKIVIMSKREMFDDYEEIRHVAKHEFGHALGLGDLYFSPKDGLYGVEKNRYFELECYRINDEMFNLVMCDHHAPVSNNDIEMVVLAFSENRRQNYQQKYDEGVISEALGKGN